jgi:pimeloyl-ACP methyl ester carboxylesterase
MFYGCCVQNLIRGRIMVRVFVAALIIGLVAGCGKSEPILRQAQDQTPTLQQAQDQTPTLVPPTATATATPMPTLIPTPSLTPPPVSSDFQGKVDIGGYELYLNCTGSGSPTVILEAGYNDVAETWSLVQPEVAWLTRVCSYDRAGLGQSDPSLKSGSSLQIVQELRALLKNAGVEGPFVLVGHSLGGMYARLFADRYREDVVGLVLVDSSHIDQFQRNAQVLPPASPHDSESLKFYRDWFTNPPSYPSLKRELFEPGSLGDVPLVVLTSPEKERAEDLPVGLSAKFDQIWVELQKEWALISSNSTHVIAYESGHFIQHDQPELVVDAILQVVAAARQAQDQTLRQAQDQTLRQAQDQTLRQAQDQTLRQAQKPIFRIGANPGPGDKSSPQDISKMW